MSKKRCYCQAELLADGTCRWRCPPEASPGHLRTQRAKQRAVDNRSTTIGLSAKDREALSKVSTADGSLGERFRAPARRGGLNSHRPGARR